MPEKNKEIGLADRTRPLLPRSNFIEVGRVDGNMAIQDSDIRSMASQDDNSHYSITSSVARASASSNSRSRSTSKSTLVGHSDHGVGVRMLGTLNARHGNAATAQDHVVSISNGEAHV